MFEKFGLGVVEFFVQGIQVQGESPEYKKIKETLADAASLKIRAKAASEAKGYYRDQQELDALNQSVKEAQYFTRTIDRKISNEKEDINNESKNSQRSGDLKVKLETLRELLDSGLITKADYDKKRFKLLDQI